MNIEHNNDTHIKADFYAIVRRGFQLGSVQETQRPILPTTSETVSRWQQHQAIMLPGLLCTHDWQAEIQQSHQLMQDVLTSAQLSPHLDRTPYPARLSDPSGDQAGAQTGDPFSGSPFSDNPCSDNQFLLRASSMEEHDEQGIEKVYFDAVSKQQTADDEATAEDLWCKASWLSFLHDDASLRFRFSFGMEAMQDVAADPLRQFWAARLCDALFPESAALTENPQLLSYLQQLLGASPAFVERIVYFNAPSGGAQMHHDVERGHDGVVFAQLSGSTFWLALSKPHLMQALIDFCADPAHQADIASVLPASSDQAALEDLLQNRMALSDYLEEHDHEIIEAVMDRCPAFIGYLCGQGFAHILHPGDVLLMPQSDLEHCVWHSVCCLGDEPGEALSFAVRANV